MRNFRENKELLSMEVKHPILGTLGCGKEGAFKIPSPVHKRLELMVICSSGGGWDHVSVSLGHRCPNWEEISHIKELFFEDNETVVQFFPKKENKVKNYSSPKTSPRSSCFFHYLHPFFIIIPGKSIC